MHSLSLAALTRLLSFYCRFRPLIMALFFSLLLSLSVFPSAALAQANAFTLQVASCESAPEAEAVVATLRQHGITAEISTADVWGRGTVLRVRAGKFATVEAARARGEQWRAAGWIASYWIARQEATSTLTTAAVTRDTATRKRTVTTEKTAPEMSLGELLQALSDKWTLRVPENLRAYAAAIVFPKARIVRPAVVLLAEGQARLWVTPPVKRREFLHPLELRLEPGIKNSPTHDSMKFAQAERLAASLRSISGYADLTFDERGVLVLGERIVGGSALARTLLRAALESHEAFEIGNKEGSDLVVFGAYLSAHFKNSERRQVKLNKIELDFRDFEQLRGDPSLLAAFDPGFVFLHELAHGVWELADDERGGLGECETFINQIRRELGLPERLSYFYKVRRQPNGSEWGEIMFLPPATGARRRQALKLIWDNRAVNSYIKPLSPATTSPGTGEAPTPLPQK